jgi:glycerol-3-phosphate dehydrogenase (NAD(P)+)
MIKSFQNIGIIGGGAWGTALATVARRAGCNVLLWAFEPEVATTINSKHENKIFLPGTALDAKIKATNNLADLSACDALLLAVPGQFVRGIAIKLALLKFAKEPVPIIICTKGIEQDINPKLMSEVLAESLSRNVTQPLSQHILAVLSGPSFAAEVAHDKPTALTLAIKDQALGIQLTDAFATRHFRLYLTDDVTGAQIGGAVKNVLAVACGIAAGYRLGDNARAALITRGLAELTRLGVAMGAKPETLMGLSGLGDLVLTCSSTQSRNMSLGMALGEGTILADILAKRTSVTEGVFTAAAAKLLADKHKVEMPIVTAVDAVLNKGAALEDTIEALLARPMRGES